MSMNLVRRKAGLSLIAVAAVALGACSSAASPSVPPPSVAAPSVAAPSVAAPSVAASQAPSAAAASPSAAASAASGAYVINVATGAPGMFLTGEGGKTVYTFKPDEAAAGKSTCNAGCDTNWPPFKLDTGETATAGAGVTGSIATIKRDDGSMQVTYNGKPLYYFGGDAKAGDTNGQGIAGKWFAAKP